MNWLLLFIPITLVLEHLGVPPTLLFFSAAIAIVPIAALIVRATEQVASRTGEAVGGLLNATFGNAPELIICLVALKAGYLEMVRAALIGGILANLLLAMGAAFFLGGLRNHTQSFNANAARMYSSTMLLAVISMAVPSAFSRAFAPEGMVREEQMPDLGSAVTLLRGCGVELRVPPKTDPGAVARTTIAAEGESEGHGHGGKVWSLQRAIGSLIGASLLAAWMSEILVGAAEGTGKALGMSDIFIGVVFLAVIGGAAESGSAIAVARRNRMDLAIGIALGSCIQIALFIAPVLVLASYFIAPHPLELSFNKAELGALGFGVLVGALVFTDGQSNWFKGVQLMTVYAFIAMMFYFIPDLGA